MYDDPNPHNLPLLEYSRPTPYMRPPFAQAVLTIFISTVFLMYGLLLGWAVVVELAGSFGVGWARSSAASALAPAGLAAGLLCIGGIQLWRVIQDLRGTRRPDPSERRVQKDLAQRVKHGG